jgi:hypothetical protein
MKLEFTQLRVMKVHLESLDLCCDCSKRTVCPLIDKLRDKIAVLTHESIIIDECVLYSKRRNKCQK